MNSEPVSGKFYTTDAAVKVNAECYVERFADQDLFNALSDGDYCFVLTTRQMGKSSLMVRVGKRLADAGAKPVYLDFTQEGQNLTPEQLYFGLGSRIGTSVGLEDEVEEWMLDQPNRSPLQKLFGAIEHVVLARVPGQVVIFIDEVDAVRSLPFKMDEFFAAVREMYNRRAVDPELNRLCFCLLGVASPSDLIQDVRTTPFNIGRRIVLGDFTDIEASGLSRGLGREAPVSNALLARCLHWTGGHPRLTQKLCAEVADDPTVMSDEGVDRKCAELFFAKGSSTTDNNLAFVGNMIAPDEKLRAISGLSEETVLQRLNLVHKVLRGDTVADSDVDETTTAVKLSGLLKPVDGKLVVRNRIYAKVFDKAWVRDKMPGSELRRLKEAERRGMMRVMLTAGAVSAAFVALGAFAWGQKSEADVAKGKLQAQVAKLTAQQQELDDAKKDVEDKNRELGVTNARIQKESKDKLAAANAKALAEGRLAAASRKMLAQTQQVSAARARELKANSLVAGKEKLAKAEAEARRKTIATMAYDFAESIHESEPLKALPYLVAALENSGNPRSNDLMAKIMADPLTPDFSVPSNKSAVSGNLIAYEVGEKVRVINLLSGKQTEMPGSIKDYPELGATGYLLVEDAKGKLTLIAESGQEFGILTKCEALKGKSLSLAYKTKIIGVDEDREGEVRIFSFDTASGAIDFKSWTKYYGALTPSPSGRWLIASDSSTKNHVRIDLSTGAQQDVTKIDDTGECALDDSGKLFASQSDNGALTVTNLDTGHVDHRPFISRLESIEWAPKSLTLLAHGSDRALRVISCSVEGKLPAVTENDIFFSDVDSFSASDHAKYLFIRGDTRAEVLRLGTMETVIDLQDSYYYVDNELFLGETQFSCERYDLSVRQLWHLDNLHPTRLPAAKMPVKKGVAMHGDLIVGALDTNKGTFTAAGVGARSGWSQTVSLADLVGGSAVDPTRVAGSSALKATAISAMGPHMVWVVTDRGTRGFAWDKPKNRPVPQDVTLLADSGFVTGAEDVAYELDEDGYLTGFKGFDPPKPPNAKTRVESCFAGLDGGYIVAMPGAGLNRYDRNGELVDRVERAWPQDEEIGAVTPNMGRLVTYRGSGTTGGIVRLYVRNGRGPMQIRAHVVDKLWRNGSLEFSSDGRFLSRTGNNFVVDTESTRDGAVSGYVLSEGSFLGFVPGAQVVVTVDETGNVLQQGTRSTVVDGGLLRAAANASSGQTLSKTGGLGIASNVSFPLVSVRVQSDALASTAKQAWDTRKLDKVPGEMIDALRHAGQGHRLGREVPRTSAEARVLNLLEEDALDASLDEIEEALSMGDLLPASRQALLAKAVEVVIDELDDALLKEDGMGAAAELAGKAFGFAEECLALMAKSDDFDRDESQVDLLQDVAGSLHDFGAQLSPRDKPESNKWFLKVVDLRTRALTLCDDETRPTLLLNRGAAYTWLDEWKLAAADYAESARLSPSVTVFLRLATACAETNHLDEALEALSEAEKLAEDEDEKASVSLAKARLYKRSGDWDKAASAFQIALAGALVEEDETDALQLLVAVLVEAGRPTEAAPFAKRLAEKKEASVVSHLDLAFLTGGAQGLSTELQKWLDPEKFTSDAIKRSAIARAACLVPGLDVDLKLAMTWAEANGQELAGKRIFVMALVRSGQYEKAAQVAADARNLVEKTDEDSWLRPYTWVVSALAEAKLGHMEEAKRYLAMAVEFRAKMGAIVDAQHDIASDWFQRLELDTLIKEVGELVRSGVQDEFDDGPHREDSAA